MAKSIDEIAKMAGVSVTSVRLVINGQDKKYRISEKTRDRIQSIIDEHGYFINQTARSLKLRKTQTLGLVVPRLTNPFFSMLMEQLEARCRAAGYQIITVCSRDEENLEAEITGNLIYRDVDGLFVTSSQYDRQVDLLKNCNNKPVVFLDRDFGVPDICVATTDNLEGGRMLGRKLAGILEGRKLYFLGGDSWLPTIEGRIKGLVEGLKEEGYTLPDENIWVDGFIKREHGYEMMERLCKELNGPPEAIVTCALPALEGGLEYIKKTYGAIPQDMVVASFDDHAMLEFLPNRVLSVRQNAPVLAEEAFRMMETLIKKEPLAETHKIIAPELIVR